MLYVLFGLKFHKDNKKAPPAQILANPTHVQVWWMLGAPQDQTGSQEQQDEGCKHSLNKEDNLY